MLLFDTSLHKGVPQGSVFAPLLLIICIRKSQIVWLHSISIPTITSSTSGWCCLHFPGRNKTVD